jgi:UDP-N-acetylglucosamine--N-acetylmuramyl-(pentapeptide) pyrophosphoryl-undecaprenol N-acetylglucosamine transferase
MRAMREAKAHFRVVKPDAAIGMGGFPSVPGGLAAWRMKIPLAIHQSDAVAGSANRLLARFAQRVLTGFASTFENRTDKRVITGNPIRREFVNQASAAVRFTARSGALNVLVMGGSRGATALNTIVPKAIAALPEISRPNMIHQVGAGLADTTSKCYSSLGVSAQVVEFIDESWNAMANADLFIGRAGASTVSELAAVGVPAIFVPYPHHADQQQLHNARILERAGAAKIIEQAALDANSLSHMIASLDRTTLSAMAMRATGVAQVNATENICNAIESMCVAQREARHA